MSYAIELLEKEKAILLKCLSDWDLVNYPEARLERQKKINNLDKAINKLCKEKTS